MNENDDMMPIDLDPDYVDIRSQQIPSSVVCIETSEGVDMTRDGKTVHVGRDLVSFNRQRRRFVFTFFELPDGRVVAPSNTRLARIYPSRDAWMQSMTDDPSAQLSRGDQ